MSRVNRRGWSTPPTNTRPSLVPRIEYWTDGCHLRAICALTNEESAKRLDKWLQSRNEPVLVVRLRIKRAVTFEVPLPGSVIRNWYSDSIQLDGNKLSDIFYWNERWSN